MTKLIEWLLSIGISLIGLLVVLYIVLCVVVVTSMWFPPRNQIQLCVLYHGGSECIGRSFDPVEGINK